MESTPKTSPKNTRPLMKSHVFESWETTEKSLKRLLLLLSFRSSRRTHACALFHDRETDEGKKEGYSLVRVPYWVFLDNPSIKDVTRLSAVCLFAPLLICVHFFELSSATPSGPIIATTTDYHLPPPRCVIFGSKYFCSVPSSSRGLLHLFYQQSMP